MTPTEYLQYLKMKYLIEILDDKYNITNSDRIRAEEKALEHYSIERR